MHNTLLIGLPATHAARSGSGSVLADASGMLLTSRSLSVVAVLFVAASCVGQAPPDIDGTDATEDNPEDQSLIIEAGAVDQGIIYDAEERALFSMINQLRLYNGLYALRASVALSERAGTGSGGDIRISSHETAATAFASMGNAMREKLLLPNYRRIGLARDLSSSGNVWTIMLSDDRDAILSVGIPSIVNDSGFETTIDAGHEEAASIRTPGRWFFAGRDIAVHFRQEAAFAGNVGLTVFADTTSNVATATQVVRAAPGVHYRVSAMTRLEVGYGSVPTQFLRLQFLDGSFRQIGGTSVETNRSNLWNRMETVATPAPSGTAYVRIVIGDSEEGYVGPATVGGTYDYDAINLQAF